MKQVGIALMLMLAMAVSATASDFVVTSPQLEPGGKMTNEQVFKGFGCEGENLSPQLDWSGEPTGTKSFAVTVYDPDAPTGSGWWHWVAFNIPATTHQLAKGVSKTGMPAGSMESRTDFGAAGYGGACPPAGDTPHRYFFTVWALDTEKIDLDTDASGAMVGFFLNSHQLGKATVTVSYGR